MAIATHYLYAVDIDSTLFDQVTDFGIDPRLQEAILGSDGGVYPTYAGLNSQAPAISFTLTGIAAALAKAGLTGFKVEAGSTAVCYFQKGAAGGTRAGATSHFKQTVGNGIIVPRQINAGQDAPATISYELIPISTDGAATPIAFATGQSLAGSPSVSEIFYCGKVMINNTQLEGIQNITVDFGIQLEVIAADGHVFPTYVGIRLIQPSITIRTLDVLALNTFGISGVAQGASDSIVYLRKGLSGGARTADATAEHISFTIDEGRISVTNVGGSHGPPSMSDVRISPVYDGTYLPLVISTATAIA